MKKLVLALCFMIAMVCLVATTVFAQGPADCDNDTLVNLTVVPKVAKVGEPVTICFSRDSRLGLGLGTQPGHSPRRSLAKTGRVPDLKELNNFRFRLILNYPILPWIPPKMLRPVWRHELFLAAGPGGS